MAVRKFGNRFYRPVPGKCGGWHKNCLLYLVSTRMHMQTQMEPQGHEVRKIQPYPNKRTSNKGVIYTMNRRIEKRLRKSLLAYSNGEASNLLGVISNISRTGLFLETRNVFDPDSHISFVLAVYNDRYELEGEVMWSKRPGEVQPKDIPHGMGIRIVDAPQEFLNYVEYIKYQSRYSMRLSH